MGTKNSPTSPGRRGGDAKVREDLLNAARKLYGRQEFAAVTVKDIAAVAKANPAMIHYYFGGKQGLYRALVEATIAPVFEMLLALDDGPAPTLEGFMRRYGEMIGANPWWPNFVIREVLFGKGKTRAMLKDLLQERALPRLKHLLVDPGGGRRLRGDLDPARTLMSLISLLVFPYAAAPFAAEVFGLDLRTANHVAMTEHSVRLFFDGAAIP